MRKKYLTPRTAMLPFDLEDGIMEHSIPVYDKNNTDEITETSEILTNKRSVWDEK